MKDTLGKNPENYFCENENYYLCEKCNYTTKNKKDFKRHLTSKKHNKGYHGNKKKSISKTTKVKAKKSTTGNFECLECGKIYKYASGLYRHKKICKPINSQIEYEIDPEKESLKKEVEDLKQMMKLFMGNTIKKQNQVLEHQKKQEEYAKYLKEVVPTLGNTTNNNTMNINIYLNEHCKNAMNLTDFVENVKVSLEDLLYTKNHGYVKGISNIFVKQLKDMEPTQRPIHCSDKKRLQFYVKDDNKWEKDNSNEKIDKSIDKITKKQILAIKLWEKEHPNYLEDEKLTRIWSNMIKNMGTGVSENVTAEKEKTNIKKELGITVQLKTAIEQHKIDNANEI